MPASSINLGVGTFPEFDQSKYPELYVDSMRIRQALINLQTAVDRYTGAVPLDSKLQGASSNLNSLQIGNIARLYVLASENLSYGQMINFHNVSGVMKARKAYAVTLPTLCRGVCTSKTSIAIGEYAEVALIGAVAGLSGLTPASLYYLSDSAGYISLTPGTVSQPVGYAISESELYINPQII